MPKTKRLRGKCLTCGKTTSPRWYRLPEGLNKYIVMETYTRREYCTLCHVRLKPDTPSVKPSTIKGAGNGLFADRDYKWGETVTMYTGKVYSEYSKVPNSNYVLQRGGFWIDGAKGFKTGLGRYINGTRNGKKPNVYFGYQYIGHEIPIKVLTRSMAKKKGLSTDGDYGLLKGKELFITYGAGYWRRVRQ